MKISRRAFLAGTGAAALSTAVSVKPSMAAISDESYATIIDLTLCDGCEGEKQPLCVGACRKGNSAAFPQPEKDQLRDYWPQKSHSDWSTRQDVDDQLTPYNWLFVQRVTVDGKTISIPRRCMHCDSPACVKLCPFGVNHKTAEGPVWIDPKLCFGGAKCQTVCPWLVPQRQAGVGIYTLWQSFMPVGGGVMYKCDLCRERLADNKKPYCMEKCPKNAMRIGKRGAIFQEAQEKAKKFGGYLYGMDENGGTSTLYLSAVPFTKIDAAIADTIKSPEKAVHMGPAENMLEQQRSWAAASLAAPVVGAVAAFVAATKKEEK